MLMELVESTNSFLEGQHNFARPLSHEVPNNILKATRKTTTIRPDPSVLEQFEKLTYIPKFQAIANYSLELCGIVTPKSILQGRLNDLELMSREIYSGTGLPTILEGLEATAREDELRESLWLKLGQAAIGADLLRPTEAYSQRLEFLKNTQLYEGLPPLKRVRAMSKLIGPVGLRGAGDALRILAADLQDGVTFSDLLRSHTVK